MFRDCQKVVVATFISLSGISILSAVGDHIVVDPNPLRELLTIPFILPAH